MELDDASLAGLVQAPVLVIGDCMLDRYWMGDVQRISPEAPVPIISVQETEKRMGGAANVARNIISVGGRPILLTLLGDDEAGHELSQMLEEEGIDARLHFDPGMKTTVKLRMVSRNQQLLRADFESSPSDSALQSGLDYYDGALGDARVVLVSDYGKGGTRNISTMIERAHAQGCEVYIDPKGRDYSPYRGATLITPNLHEFQHVMGEVYAFDEIDMAAQELMQALQIEACLVTLSERGMLLCRAAKKPIHQATRAREVYDVTGAGDTVIAMMALARAAGMHYEQAMALANHAAGIVVNKMGTAAATLEEIKASMRRSS